MTNRSGHSIKNIKNQNSMLHNMSISSDEEGGNEIINKNRQRILSSSHEASEDHFQRTKECKYNIILFYFISSE